MSNSDSAESTVSEAYAADCFSTKVLAALLLIICGLSLTFVAIGLLGGYACFTLFACGCGLWFGGCFVLIFKLDITGVAAEFRADRRGLGYQLVAFIVGLGVVSVVWFALGWPADMVFNIFSGMYVFSGFPAVALDFAHGVFRLLPAIMLGVSVLWIWVSSNRREEATFFG